MNGQPLTEFTAGFAELSGETTGDTNWYYVDAYRIDSATPQQLEKYGPWQATAASAARIYDGMCGKYQSANPTSVLTRCYVWLPASSRWVPCGSSVGFPGTVFCGRLDRS